MLDKTCQIGGNAIIGYSPENDVRRMRFNIGKWLRVWPDLTAQMLVTRPGESDAYVAKTQIEGEEIVWTISAYDTAIAGNGSMWIAFHGEEGELGLTPRTSIMVADGPPNIDGEEPPQTAAPWVLAVLDAAKRAEEAAERAEGAGGTGGATGEDGGFYTPSVDGEGNLTWMASKDGMSEVAGANIRGPKGADGKDGKQGADGKTPVKGEDYWTESDKEQIVADVLKALPIWTEGEY